MQWPNEGYVVHQSTLDQRKVKLFETADGIGVVWSEIRDEVDFDLFYQRFNLEGQMQFDSSGNDETSRTNQYGHERSPENRTPSVGGIFLPRK